MSTPNPNPRRVTLQGLRFRRHDLRGVRGFPSGPGGLVYEHVERRVVACLWTGKSIERRARYVVRTAAGEPGWRVDLEPRMGPTEAIYGPDRADHWTTRDEAVAALVAHLDHVRDNSTLGGSR